VSRHHMATIGSMASRPARKLMTEEQYLRLPESMSKMELLDGEVVREPSPDFWHQELLSRIVLALNRWAERQEHPVTVCQSPLHVRFARGRILQPDAFVLFDEVSPSHKGPLDRIPELCIEVLSSDRVHDRVTKRMIYAASGVREYWVVDQAGIVERWFGS